MHRIGRTARAGKSGIAISFCSNDEKKYFTQIERLLGFHIPRAVDNPLQSEHEEPLPTSFIKDKSKTKKYNSRGNNYKKSSKNQFGKFDKPSEKKRVKKRTEGPKQTKS